VTKKAAKRPASERVGKKQTATEQAGSGATHPAAAEKDAAVVSPLGPVVVPPKPPLPALADRIEAVEPVDEEPGDTGESVEPELTRPVAEPWLGLREQNTGEEQSTDAGRADPLDVTHDRAPVQPMRAEQTAVVIAPPTEPEPEPEPEPASAVAAAVPVPPVDTASPRAPVLVLRELTKSFRGSVAVDGIDLVVPEGTFYGLVGPNGAGKTTTLSMIAGLLLPDSGMITVHGIDAIAHPREAKRAMGVLPDRLRTFDRLTGRQLLMYYGLLRGLDGTVVSSRTADLARAFEIEDALARPVSDYSAGMTKKVMLAGAMIHAPRLLVLDEPFEAVDPVSSSVILEILGAYVAHGGTVILSSHGMEMIEAVCERVAVLVSGRVLAEGPVADVRGELTLQQRYAELTGVASDVEGLEWLHTFSG
jgi:ABC-2 type transport system ATP-binding protein